MLVGRSFCVWIGTVKTMGKHRKLENGIQKCRIRAGIRTAEEAASLLGTPYGSYRNWEQGDSFPRPEMLIRLAETFRCSIDDLFGYRPDQRCVEDIANASAISDLRYLKRLYEATGVTGDRDLLMAFARVLAGEYDGLEAETLLAISARTNTAIAAVLRGRERSTRGDGRDPEVPGSEEMRVAEG